MNDNLNIELNTELNLFTEEQDCLKIEFDSENVKRETAADVFEIEHTIAEEEIGAVHIEKTPLRNEPYVLLDRSAVTDYLKNKKAKLPAKDKCFQCATCGKKFKTRKSMRWHLIIHTKNTFACPVCQKVFKAKMYMRRHMRLHDTYRPFKCNVCEKTFILEGLRYV